MEPKGSDTVPDISDYEYRILKYIHDSPDPVTEELIQRKFKPSGLAVTKDMISHKLIVLQFTGDSILDRDDDSPLKLTDSGLAAYQSYTHDNSRKKLSVWKERLYGFLIAIVLEWVKDFLYPEFIEWITNAVQSLQK